jgi:UDP-N-acetylmuramyl pentapeptide synthase
MSSQLFLDAHKLELFTGGKWISFPTNELSFNGIGLNSGNLFFPVERVNKHSDEVIANRYQKAIRRGVSAIVVSNLRVADYLKNQIPVFWVDNLDIAAISVARLVRTTLNPYTILITGTEGKTGAKVQLHHLLKSQVAVHAVLDSNNTIIPVMRSLMSLSNLDKIEVNEVSVGSDVSHNMLKTFTVNPDMCLYTNIGPNYMSIHGSMDVLIDRKASLVEGMRWGAPCLINANNEYASQLIERIKTKRPDARIFTYGIKDNDQAQLIHSEFDKERFGWLVQARVLEQHVDYFIPSFQSHFPLASVGALLAVSVAGYDVNLAAQNYPSLSMFESMGLLEQLILPTGQSIIFYNQSTRADISGVVSAFDDLTRLTYSGKMVALLGGVGVFEDNEWIQSSHARIAELINDSPIEILYTTGPFMEYVYSGLTVPVWKGHSNDRKRLLYWLLNSLEAGDCLFMMASGYLELEAFVQTLRDYVQSGKQLSDESLIDYPDTYRLLLTYDELEHSKLYPFQVCVKHGLDFITFQQLAKRYQNKVELSQQILFSFFESLPSVLSKSGSFECCDEMIITAGYASRVFNEEFCLRWFDESDKQTGRKSKTAFGRFFFTRQPDWLLYIAVGTTRLYVGLVHVDKLNDKSIRYERLSEEILRRYLAESFEDLPVSMTYQNWAKGWLAIELAQVKDLTDWSSFSVLNRIDQTPVYREKLVPLLRVISR